MEKVSVLIKCPSIHGAPIQDYELEINRDADVAELKAFLAQNHPLRPLANEQRLVFLGSILEDGERLSTLVAKGNHKSDRMVVHMVLRKAVSDSSGVRSASKSGPVGKIEPVDSAADTINPTKPAPSSNTSNLESARPVLYGYVNREGQMVYADVSNALIYDGRTFFRLCGSDILSRSGNSTPVADGRRSQRHRRFRLRININQLFGLAFRLFLVVTLFSPNASRLKLLVLCGGVVLVFLFQSGLIGIPQFVRNLGQDTPRHRRDAEPQQDVPAEPQQDTALPRTSAIRELFNLAKSFLFSLVPMQQLHNAAA